MIKKENIKKLLELMHFEITPGGAIFLNHMSIMNQLLV